MIISRSKFSPYFLMLTSISIMLNGCAAPSSIIVWATRPMIAGAMQALMSETDLELAKTSFESNLKLIDGFLELKPNDYQLLTLATQGYAGYSLIYCEDNFPQRGSEFYDRSLSYGFRALSAAGYDLQRTGQSFTLFREGISSLKQKDINAVYWTALAWAGKLNLNRSAIYAIAEFPRVLLMMEWILDQDPHFFYSGPLWFLGIYYSSIPVIIGGDTEKAKLYFDSAIKANGENFLLGKVWMAEYYYAQTIDRKQFLNTLTEVVAAPQNEPSEIRLINSFARIKAADLLSQTDLIYD